jgi:hypothetical protein
MGERRASDAEGFAAALVALRAQGLEPSEYAKELARKVVAGEMTLADMEGTLEAHYRAQRSDRKKAT